MVFLRKKLLVWAQDDEEELEEDMDEIGIEDGEGDEYNEDGEEEYLEDDDEGFDEEEDENF